MSGERRLFWMDTNRSLARLIGRVYDAGIGSVGWQEVLADLTPSIGAEAAALFVGDYGEPGGGIHEIALHGYPADVPVTYGSYYAARDVRLPAVARLASGETYVDDRSMPFADVERSEIFHDFYRPMGLAHGIAMRPFAEGQRSGILSAHRGLRAGAFHPDEIAVFETLAPHVRRALQLQRQMARANAVAAGLAITLDHFPMAALLVDATARVAAMNNAAEALLRSPGSPLRLSSQRVIAAAPSDASALRRIILQAAALAGGGPAAMSGDNPAVAPPVLRLARTDGSGRIGVMAVPARDNSKFDPPAGTMVILFLSDPAAAPTLAPKLLMAQFGLSPTEAQVAAKLAAGERIEDIADARQVSRETVRAQVKSLLAKTDTRGQGQLIGLVARSLASLRTSFR